LLERVVTTQLI
ncbi:hypothetical protein AB1N83_009700, partial [Pleurotus pulmonarius]